MFGMCQRRAVGARSWRACPETNEVLREHVEMEFGDYGSLLRVDYRMGHAFPP